MLVVHSHRTSLEKIIKQYTDAIILDVTSHGFEPWIRFSPFYPHSDIPVPFSPGWVSMSVEGIWQGLKVFEQTDVDSSKFAITTMKGLKRSTRKFGTILGHRKGMTGDQLLAYLEARATIYLPSYRWVLEHRLQDLIAHLQELEREKIVVLLDYETNSDIYEVKRPLSHAGLMKLYLEGNWPMNVSY